jgi:hypothetical protein
LSRADEHLNRCSVCGDASTDFDAFGGLTFGMDVVYEELSVGDGDTESEDEKVCGQRGQEAGHYV